MGWLVPRTGEDGRKLYMAVYRDLKGKQRSAGTFERKRDANRAWHKAESEIAAGKVGDPKRGRQTFRRYVEEEWFPNHIIEATTREGYTYTLNRYVLPEFGSMRMVEILPGHVREWIVRMQASGTGAPMIKQCKVVLDAILTTALNDQITFLHAGKGVKTPPVVKKPKRIITAQQFELIYDALEDNTMRLLVETDIESGLRWGELTELRPKDIEFDTGMLTVSRVVVQLKAKDRPDGVGFVVKPYPKDKEWRQLKLAIHLVEKLKDHIATLGLGPDDLLFELRQPTQSRRRTLPEEQPDPATLGLTEPNELGRTYRHGTTSAYTAGRCRCQYCRDAMAFYRASRRSSGKDSPRKPRTVNTDGHIGNDWFRRCVWYKAIAVAKLGFHITPHGLRHAHASWLLAGGADLLAVKDRLGHASITTTEQYLHSLPGAHDAALDALDAIRGTKGVAKPKAAPTQRRPDRDEVLAMMATIKEMYEALDSEP
ncbi:MAG TPA: integrase [Micromonosporaceae bacterium]|nr:integrase [Micromonosporaceae bacterium]